jgi:hypothetical protein
MRTSLPTALVTCAATVLAGVGTASIAHAQATTTSSTTTTTPSTTSTTVAAEPTRTICLSGVKTITVTRADEDTIGEPYQLGPCPVPSRPKAVRAAPAFTG